MKLTNKQIDEASQLYEDGKSTYKLAEVFDVSPPTITKYIKNNGTKIRKNGQYPFNENVFNKMNEESTYWLGFLLSDGNIGDTNKFGQDKIIIGLGKEDTDHLYKFQKFMETDKPVYEYDEASVFEFSSDKISKKLSEFNIIPRKSKIAKVPKDLINNKHFWRGMIDGDGCIFLPKQDKIGIKLTGTKKVCNQFRNYVKKFSYTNANVTLDNGAYKFKVEGNKVVPPIIEHFYKNANIYLDRKYKLAKKYF